MSNQQNRKSALANKNKRNANNRKDGNDMIRSENIDSPLEFVKKDSARARISEAFLMDEAIRKGAEIKSYKYLWKKEKENDTPNWVYNLWYFMLGMLALATVNEMFDLNLNIFNIF
jgi:hypothetical protein